MSLSLDALRKSEAERRKAQAASDALAEVPRAPASPLGGVPVWVWPAVGLVAVALTVWLWRGRPAETGALPPTPPANVGAADGNTGDPSFPGAGAQDSRLALPTSAAGDAPPSAATATIAPPITSAGNAPSAAATTLPATTQATAPSSAPAPSVAAIPAAATPRADATTVPTPVAAAVRTSPPTVALPSPTGAPSNNIETAAVLPRSPGAPASTSPYPAGSPLRLSDLSTADRQQLPPLKMSLHMWGAEAGKRFAIIDGNRVGEGDRVGDAVVAAIEQDGVVLAWNGIRLRVPVR